MPSVTQDRLHFPRNRLAYQILGSFEAQLQTAVTVFAPRRKGKTTFVNRDLIPMAREKGFIVATADLWMDRDHPERVISGALHEAIFGAGLFRRTIQRFARPGSLLKSVKGGAGHDGVTLEAELAQDQALSLQELFERFRSLGKGRALLIIDEVQHLATRNEFESLTATLRALLQSAQGEVFALFTGSSQEGLAKMFRRSKAPFYQFSSEVPFHDLGMEFAQHLGAAYKDVTGREWEVTEAFAKFVARGQMPMYLRELYKLCLTQNISVAEADKIAWGSMVDEGQFESVLRDLPPLDQAVLVGILTGQSLFSADYRAALADDLPSGQAPSTQQVQVALNRLKRRDLVANLDHGTWGIEDAALESYLRRLLIDGIDEQ